MRRLRLLVVGLAASTLTACISMTTVVKVAPDGSGTVTQTMVMQPEVAEMMAGMAAMGKEEGGPAPELFPEKELRAKAAKMGAGVALLSSRRIDGKEGKGVEAVYSFKDIRTLQIEEKPTPPLEGVKAQGESEAPQFALTRLANGHSQLVVTFPERKREAGAAEKAPEKAAQSKPPDAADMEKARQILKGLRIGLHVEAGRTVVKTNSPYLKGNRVTLMELDFEALLSDQKKLAALMSTGPEGSLEDAKRILQGLPGIKLNLDRQVTIEFQ
jgi:hypothetical protein